MKLFMCRFIEKARGNLKLKDSPAFQIPEAHQVFELRHLIWQLWEIFLALLKNIPKILKDAQLDSTFLCPWQCDKTAFLKNNVSWDEP